MSETLVVTEVVNTVVVTPVENTVEVASVGVQGPAGATGATGATGAAGSSGVVTVNAPITNAGTSSAANLSVSSGTTSAVGVLQLTDSTSSTSTTTAATPNAVKTVNDIARQYYIPFYSGFYYRNPSNELVATTNATLNMTYYIPFFVPETASFDRIAIKTGSAHSGSSTTRLGIYSSTSGKPSTLVLDAGTVVANAANTTFQITINQSLTSGLYFLAAALQSAATTSRFIQLAVTQSIPYIGAPNDATLNLVQAYTQSGVSGAFANAGTLSNLTATGATVVMVRAV